VNGLPDGFRQLDGSELDAARLIYRNHLAALKPEKDGRLRGLHLLTRPLDGVGSLEAHEPHIAAICAAAQSIGDQSVLIAGPVSVDLNDVGVIAVDVGRLPEFAESLDFMDTDESMVPKSASDWPERAKRIAFPDLELPWTLLSPSGHWGLVITDAADFVILSGPEEFIESYRAVRAEAIYDIILWLHSLRGLMTNVEGARTGFFRKRRGERRPTRDNALKRLMESAYAVEDSEWIWDLYCELLMDGYGQSAIEGWKKWEKRLFGRIAEIPGANERLTRIWRTSRPR
jgi:hypothetical protein